MGSGQPQRLVAEVRRNLKAKLIELRLPAEARVEVARDKAGLPKRDPGLDSVIDASIAWLCRAQDCSTSHDGGVARHFSLLTGWADSYPETTGYIVPTMIACAEAKQSPDLLDRARRMLDFLVEQQLPCGGFAGGTVNQKSLVPVTFNTGQILIGLAAGVRTFGDAYREPMQRAADWLVETQDIDGGWRKYPTPFAGPGIKAYETHVAWGLVEAARFAHPERYMMAALSNARWALQFQHSNGWFDNCCLEDPVRPITHTLGYVLRGLLEIYRGTGEESILAASRQTADGLVSALASDGFLPGRLDQNWRPAVAWACLTGTAQIACCWLILYEMTGDARYRDAACAANSYVRRTIRIDGPEDIRGAVKAQFPIKGNYNPYHYLNWACKFTIDANLMEKATQQAQRQVALNA